MPVLQKMEVIRKAEVSKFKTVLFITIPVFIVCLVLTVLSKGNMTYGIPALVSLFAGIVFSAVILNSFSKKLNSSGLKQKIFSFIGTFRVEIGAELPDNIVEESGLYRYTPFRRTSLDDRKDVLTIAS